MLISSRIFLAAALAAGLVLPGVAKAAAPGFSIDLGTPTNPLTLNYDPNCLPPKCLSAAAAPSNGQPALELNNNGSYLATITGNYDVVDDLGSLDKNISVFWHRSYEITLNGHIIFGAPDQIVGPFTGEDIWQSFLFVFNQVTGLNSAVLNIIIGFLEHQPSFSFGMGEFDYAYNALNQLDGTFAVGTTVDLGQKIALNTPTNSLSFDVSLFVVPEPSTWATLLMGFAGLGFVGYRRTWMAKPQAA
jgi:hypothetical protein